MSLGLLDKDLVTELSSLATADEITDIVSEISKVDGLSASQMSCDLLINIDTVEAVLDALRERKLIKRYERGDFFEPPCDEMIPWRRTRQCELDQAQRA